MQKDQQHAAKKLQAGHQPSLRDRLFVIMQHVLPHHFISSIVYRLARSRNKKIKTFLINQAIKRFGIDLSLAINPDPAFYASFNEFFTRELRPGARKINTNPKAIACPVDGSVSNFGKIKKGKIVQAKGHSFTLHELLGGDDLWTKLFEGGEFITIYLAPKDYHRIHSPRNSTLKRTIHIPGRLFSVNPITTRAVSNLFARNERLCCLFDSDLGPMAVIMVGAMCVSSIETTWGAEYLTPKDIEYSDFGPPALTVEPKKGEELGRFNMGSTVILLFGKDRIHWAEKLKRGIKVKLGQPIGLENESA